MNYIVYIDKRDTYMYINAYPPPKKKVHSFQLCTDDRRLML